MSNSGCRDRDTIGYDQKLGTNSAPAERPHSVSAFRCELDLEVVHLATGGIVSIVAGLGDLIFVHDDGSATQNALGAC